MNFWCIQYAAYCMAWSIFNKLRPITLQCLNRPLWRITVYFGPSLIGFFQILYGKFWSFVKLNVHPVIHFVNLRPNHSHQNINYRPVEFSRWWRHDQNVLVIEPCWLVGPTFQSARLRLIFSARIFEIRKHKRETMREISSLWTW